MCKKTQNFSSTNRILKLNYKIGWLEKKIHFWKKPISTFFAQNQKWYKILNSYQLSYNSSNCMMIWYILVP